MGRISTATSTVYVVSKISEAILDHQNLQTKCFVQSVPVDVGLWEMLHLALSLMNRLRQTESAPVEFCMFPVFLKDPFHQII